MAIVELERQRLFQLAYEAASEESLRYGIGTYKEKQLHRVLKRYFEENTACHEVPLAGYIADIANEDGITEIQTSGFASMGGKLEAFLPLGPVCVVYPVAQRKWVTWIDPETGEFSKRNRSPKRGKAADVLPELIYIRRFLTHPNLTIRVVLLEIEEYRLLDGRRSISRKRGSHRFERMPLDLYEIQDIHTSEDYRSLLPEGLEVSFTSADFARLTKLRGRRLSAALRVMEDVGVIVREGKRGNAILYGISASDAENLRYDY